MTLAERLAPYTMRPITLASLTGWLYGDRPAVLRPVCFGRLADGTRYALRAAEVRYLESAAKWPMQGRPP